MEQPPGFLFVACQHGAEPVLKAELARRWPDFRFAYSRPGFVTFKLPAGHKLVADFDLHSTFARAYAFSLGKATGDDLATRVAATLKLAEEFAASDWPMVFQRLHVWQRDFATPGFHGFEPHDTPAAAEARTALVQAWPTTTAAATSVGEVATSPDALSSQLTAATEPGQLVLDCVLVEPHEWWIGYHRASALPSRWPGGRPEIARPDGMVSRAYLKMEEALRWSRMPLQPGDHCAEIGSAPGGASQALLDRGLHVLGVDPADMDPRVAEHPHFTHAKMRGADLRRREFHEVRWLMADINVAPNYTLDTVEGIVTHVAVHVHGLLLTLKLLQWHLADELPAYIERVRSWGFADVRVRQLAHNRQEVCLAALRQRDLRKRPPKAVKLPRPPQN